MQLITALEVIEGKHTTPPSGFTKINLDLNKGAGGKYIYLCYKKEESETGIVDICILDGAEKNPTGYRKCPLDLNAGAGGSYLYIAYRVGNVQESRRFGYTDIDVKSNGDNVMHYPDRGFCLNSTDLNKGAGGDYIYIVHKNASSMTMLNWMGQLSDATKLVDISIPGTHDTMAYKFRDLSKLSEPIAKTQCHNLDAQLRDGARYLDIRFDEDLDCRHGIAVCHYNLQYVFDTLISFLKENSSETILVRIGSRDDMTNRFAELMDQYKDYFWKNIDNKAISKVQLGELRGKILILNGVEKSDYFKSNQFGYSYGDDQQISRQDHYKNPSIEDKYKEIVDLLKSQDSVRLKLNHVSAVGDGIHALKWNPEAYANRLNPMVDDFLQEHEELSALGVLIFDYINTNLCWSVIKHNFMMGQYEGVCYCAHVEGYGWLQEVRDGVTAGTTGESRQMEAVKIWLKNMPEGAGISYCCHVQDLGWLPYVESGEVSGTTGKKKRMEAIRIKLVNCPGWHVWYRVHQQQKGWLEWTCDDAVAGSTGESKRIEAIEIKLVKE